MTKAKVPLQPDSEVQHPSAPKGLGRRIAPDDRDFRASAILTEVPTRSWRYWNASSWWGDQGGKPHCVAFAGTAWLEDGPVTYDGPAVNTKRLYKVCQDHDEWEGSDYAGTSVRALGRVLRDPALCQAAGIPTKDPLIDSYYFAESAIEVVRAILTTGPVVMGTDWYWNWFTPGPTGYLKWDGDVIVRGTVGGHAWKADGVRIVAAEGTDLDMADPMTWDPARSFVRGKNSWGRHWGAGGFFYVRLVTLTALLTARGEAMIAVESPRFRPS